jgi:hypothetical protein
MNYYNYFTEVEEHFVRRRGKHMFVSPLDWSLIATWRESGVPLNVALRGIDKAMDAYQSRPRRSSERLSTLFYCHDSVMAEFAAHLESHVGEGSAESPQPAAASPAQEVTKAEGPGREAVCQFLDARLKEIERLLKKLQGREPASEAVERVRARLTEIAAGLQASAQPDAESLERDLGILDELLVTELRPVLPEGRLAEWEQEAKSELKVYRKRLPKETYQKILENFMRTKTHRYFEVGELSLFLLQ